MKSKTLIPATSFCSLLIMFTSSFLLASTGEQIRIYNFPTLLSPGNWQGHRDIVFYSDTFCLLSTIKGQPSSLNVMLNSRFDDLGLHSFSSGSKKTSKLPIQIVLRQLSNNDSVVFQTPYQYLHINKAQSDCTVRDFRLDIFIDTQDLSSLASGLYQNHFSFNIENHQKKKTSRNFTVKVLIPKMIKIGFTGDLVIQKELNQNLYQGMTKACVFTNDGGYYRVRAESNNFSNGHYHLCEGKGGGSCLRRKIPYEIYYQGRYSPPYYFQSTATKSFSMLSSPSYFDSCTTSRSSAEIHAWTDQKSLESIPAGYYSDVVTFIVEAE